MTLKVLNSPLCTTSPSLKLIQQPGENSIKVITGGVDLIIPTPLLKEGVTIEFEPQQSGIDTPVENTTTSNQDLSKTEKDDEKKEVLISYGFKANSEKLSHVISESCNKIELLDSKECLPADLLEVLTSEGFKPGSKKIRLGCNNHVFRCWFFGIRSVFESLTCSKMEESNIFFDKDDNPLKATALYAAGRTKKKQPYEYVIDAILKKLY